MSDDSFWIAFVIIFPLLVFILIGLVLYFTRAPKRPPPPTNLQLTVPQSDPSATNKYQTTLTFNPPPNINTFNVYQGITDNFALNDHSRIYHNVSARSLTISGLPPNTTIYFAVTSLDKNLESIPAHISLRLPLPPPTFNGQRIGALAGLDEQRMGRLAGGGGVEGKGNLEGGDEKSVKEKLWRIKRRKCRGDYRERIYFYNEFKT